MKHHLMTNFTIKHAWARPLIAFQGKFYLMQTSSCQIKKVSLGQKALRSPCRLKCSNPFVCVEIGEKSGKPPIKPFSVLRPTEIQLVSHRENYSSEVWEFAANQRTPIGRIELQFGLESLLCWLWMRDPWNPEWSVTCLSWCIWRRKVWNSNDQGLFSRRSLAPISWKCSRNKIPQENS